MSNYELSNPEGVLLYLADSPLASSEAIPLSGGSANYVYRLRLLIPHKGHSTLVLKHGKPYLPKATDFAISLERQVR
jgi:hypothetical protein